MEQLEKEGKIYIIRPQSKVTVSRTEQDKRKLTELYEEGRRLAEAQMEDILGYLS